jgi:hypothetical protein
MTLATRKVEEAEQIQGLRLEDVMSVYSGRDGACACGCSGKHRYASKYRDIATANRGYEVTDEEVNDRQVERILKLVQDAGEEAEFDGDMATLVVDQPGRKRGTVYVVYLLPKEYRQTQAAQKSGPYNGMTREEMEAEMGRVADAEAEAVRATEEAVAK